ncbi:MAG: FAD:protein FMN transferase [Thiomicrospira sp.]|nr:FAD:protein FMN transferase [Thiomicrospira sp.]
MPSKFLLQPTLKLGFFYSLLLGASLWLTGCSAPENTTQQSFYVFGTEVQVLIVGAQTQQAQEAIQAIEQRFQTFHNEWHAWEQGGIVSKINQAIANNQAIEVPDTVKAFIQTTQKLSAQTDYLFDPAIGQLIKMWGFHSEDWQGPPPSEAERQAWLNTRPSIKDIYFKDHQLFSRNSNVQLDFGGNAKGLALDIAAQTLADIGIQNALINIGGDIKALGFKNHQAWSIGIQNPSAPSQAIAQLQAQDGDSIFTSGTYQRYFDWQGQRFSHIINPNNAWPADSFASVTVIHDDAITADTAATALLVAGEQDWQRIADQLGVKAVFIVHRDGHFEMTPAMKQRLTNLKN